MLTDEKITSNAQKYFEVGRKYDFMTDELIEFLGAEFVKAPNSTKTEYLGCFDGGLINHSLQVAKQMIIINKTLSENKKLDEKSIMKVAFLHQIGKAKLFKECKNEWQKTNQGKLYEYNNDLISMRVSERSLYYILNNGVTLTELEYQAIINYDKPLDDIQSKSHNGGLGRLLRIGNEMVELGKSK